MKVRINLVLLSLLYFPIIVQGHDGKTHISDMLAVLPFGTEHSVKGDSIYNLCESVQNFIDQSGQYPPFIKSIPQFSRLSFENHRLFMHWGFNSSPRDFSRLADDFIEIYYNQGRLSDTDVDLFWSNLENFWNSERDKVIQEACMAFYGENRRYIFVGKEEKVKAFLTILYCTHILGDLSSDRKDLVEQLPAVKADINKAIDTLARTYSFGENTSTSFFKKAINWLIRDNDKIASAFKSEMDAINNPVEYLNKLKNSFTPFVLSLSGSMCEYQSVFLERGYVLKS